MAKVHKTTTAPTAQIAPFGLRMLPELKAQIEEAAKASGRSMNAEIVARLEQSLAGGADNGLIVDQAKQIWELRQQILSDHLAMTHAVGTMKPLTPEERPAYEGLKKAAIETRQEASLAMNRIIEELIERTGEKGLSIGKELFERFTQLSYEAKAPEQKEAAKPPPKRVRRRRQWD